MDIHRNPGLLDALAAQYAVGTLRGPARRRLQTLAARHDAVRAAVNLWQQRFDALGELVPPVAVPESVWRAIEAHLALTQARGRPADAATPRPARQSGRPIANWFDSLNLWRGWAVGATLAAVVALVFALRPLGLFNETTPGSSALTRISYVSALHDAASNTTMLLTWDAADNTAHIQLISTQTLRADQAMQLWGLPATGHPVALGVLPSGAGTRDIVMKMPRPAQDFPAVAVSIEAPGGSPNPNGPTGPVVYSGKLVPTT